MGKIPFVQKRVRRTYGQAQQGAAPALIKTLRPPGDGDGLYFRSLGEGKRISSTATASTAASGKRRIGPYPEVSLDDARVRHAALRKQVIADKIDPMAEKERAKANAPAAAPAPSRPSARWPTPTSRRTRRAGEIRSTASNG